MHRWLWVTVTLAVSLAGLLVAPGAAHAGTVTRRPPC
jgi:hypothetical protein